MKKFHYLIVIILLFNNCDGNKKNETIKPEKKYIKTLLVIGDDRSGSSNKIRKLTTDDYRAIFNKIAISGGGTISVSIIGNPEPQSTEPYLISLPQLTDTIWFDNNDKDLLMQDRTNILSENKKIKSANEENLMQSKSKIDSFISSTILPKIINYHSDGGDNTDLDESIKQINTLVHTSIFNDYDKVIVVIFSDGKNEPNGKLIPINSLLEHDKLILYLIGWTEKTECFKVSNIFNLSSKEIFIEELNNQLNKQK